jgi:hypothetical protein
MDHTNARIQADIIEWMRWLRTDLCFTAASLLLYCCFTAALLHTYAADANRRT